MKKILALLITLNLALLSCSSDEQKNEQCGTIVLIHENQSKPGFTIQVKTDTGYYLTYDDIMNKPTMGSKYCRNN
jgi:hypothetical protein